MGTATNHNVMADVTPAPVSEDVSVLATQETQSQSQPHAQHIPSQLALENARLAKMAYVKATRIAQERTQEAAQEAEQFKQDATVDSRKAKKEERYRATMAKLGKLPPCPKICRGKECSRIPCKEEEPGFIYSHIDDMVVCQDKEHLSMATRDGCLLFHLWPARKRSHKPPAGPLARHPAKNLHPAKNSGGGTSGARQAPQNRGNQRAGKPRHAGKGTQQQQHQQPRGQQRQQQQSDLAHQRVIEKLNLELEVERANTNAKTTANISYASLVKGTATAGRRQRAGDSTEGQHGLPQQEAAITTSDAVDLARDGADSARDAADSASKTVDSAREAADSAREVPKAAQHTPTNHYIPTNHDRKSLVLMTCNASRLLSSGRELALLNLLVSSAVDIATVTECKMAETANIFAVADYTTFLPLVPKGKSKTRVIILVKNDLVTSANVHICRDLMDSQT
jgi:hypothetical protein